MVSKFNNKSPHALVKQNSQSARHNRKSKSSNSEAALLIPNSLTLTQFLPEITR